MRESLDAKSQYYVKLWTAPNKSFQKSCTEAGVRRNGLATFEEELKYSMIKKTNKSKAIKGLGNTVLVFIGIIILLVASPSDNMTKNLITYC